MPHPEGTSIQIKDKGKRKAASSEQGSGSRPDFAAGKSYHGPAGQREISYPTSDSDNEATSEQRLTEADALKLFSSLEQHNIYEAEFNAKIAKIYLEEAELYSQRARLCPEEAQKYLFDKNESISEMKDYLYHEQLHVKNAECYAQKKQLLPESIPTEKEARLLMKKVRQELSERNQDKMEEVQKMLEIYTKEAQNNPSYLELVSNMANVLKNLTEEKKDLENLSKGHSHNN